MALLGWKKLEAYNLERLKSLRVGLWNDCLESILCITANQVEL
jgi:hypothetical protein